LRPFDANSAFRPTSLKQETEFLRHALRGAGATVLSGGTGLVIQIVGTVILARLLTPADFGVVTMVTSFSLLLLNFGLNGFTEAVIQAVDIDEYQVSNLFWINLGVGALLTIGFSAAGTLLARFYHYPLVARVAVGISGSILLTSLSVQHLALLKRAMRFSATSANELISRALSLVASISLALLGWGYWALVIGVLVQPLAQTIGAWSLCRWVPRLPRRAPGTSALVRFAMSVYGRFAVNYFARNTDNLLVGWRFGAISLGFYKKAYDLFALSAGQLTSPLTNVAVSALTRFKPRSAQYKQHLLAALAVVAFVGMGLSAEFAILGKDIIRLLLGPQWAPAGQIFVFFAPGIGIMLLYYTHGWIHLSIGKADRWFRWGIIEVSVTILLFLLGLHWGPIGIAAAWTASFWILTFPALWYAGKPIDFGVGPVFAAVWKYVAASLIAAGITLGICHELPTVFPPAGSPAYRIVTISILYGAMYLLAVVAFHGGWKPVYEFASLVREMIWRAESPVPVLKQVPANGVESADADGPGNSGSKPLVSILVPAYNAEQWIADTLKSAISQTWEPKEIIVVDDGSSDQTVAIARQFEAAGVRVVTQQNQGAAAARNHAFSLSRGEYIQWLDADDLLDPEKISHQMKAAGQRNSKRTLFSCSWASFIYRYYRARFVPTPLWCDLSPSEWLIRKMGQNLYMQTATWLVSRELTEAAGPWDTRLLSDDDGEYFCRVLLASDGVQFVPEARVYYRGRGLAIRNLSHVGQSARKLEALWLSMQLHIRYLLSIEESERARSACVRYLQTSLICFYPENLSIVEQSNQMAKQLGGQLSSPTLSWKYSWMKMLFGWNLAKRGQLLLLQLRWSSDRSWDRALFRLETYRFVSSASTLKRTENL
jgi:PST family polysaccharide transporter